MNRAKKIFITLCLALLVTTTANAFAPLAYLVAVTGIPAYAWVTSAAVHVGAGAVGLYYALKPGQSSTADSVGTVSRPASAVWIDTKDFQVVEKPLKAKLPKSTVEQLSTSKPTKYPNLNAATYKLSYPGYENPSALPATTQSYVSNQQINLSGSKCVKVTYVEGSPAGWNGNTDGALSGWRDWAQYSKFEVYHPTSEHSGYPKAVWIETVHYSVQTSPTPITVPKSVTDYLASVAPTGIVTDSALQAELDEMIRDPDYVPVFSDATTGLPYSSPSQTSVATDADIAKRNKEIDAYNKSGLAAEALNAAADSAAASTANARNAYAASGGDPTTGIGGDASLYQKYLDAKAGSDRAAADAAAADAAASEKAVDDDKESEDVAADVPGNEERKSLDFTPMHGLKSALSNTYPFNLPGVIAGYFTALKGTPTAPQFDLALPLGQTMHVDLSPFEPLAILLRYLIGILITCGMIWYVIHFFRGVS